MTLIQEQKSSNITKVNKVAKVKKLNNFNNFNKLDKLDKFNKIKNSTNNTFDEKSPQQRKQLNKPDPIEKLVESVAQSYLNGITKKKSGIVLINKIKTQSNNNTYFRYETLVVLQNNMYVGFPKGTMEPLETFEETAEREFQEETGIKIEEMKKRSKLINIIKGEKTQMFVYLLNDDVNRNELKIRPITQDEILHAFWVDIDLLDDMPKTLSSLGALQAPPKTLSSLGGFDSSTKTSNNNYKKSVLTMNVIKELRKLIAKKLL